MHPRGAAAVVASIVLIVGLFLGLGSLSVGQADVNCGSALAPSQSEALSADLEASLGGMSLYRAACDEEVSERRMLAFPVLGVGGLALVFLWLTKEHRTRWDAPVESADETSA